MVKLNDSKKSTEFVELQRGDTFLHGDYVYIKTDTFCIDQGTTYNAVCILDGCFRWFHSQDPVIEVDIEGVIK